jgi:uncharacterized protein (TIGR03067 family)
MRWLVAVVAMIGLLLGTARAQDDKSMDGTWVMVSGVEMGKKLSEDRVKSARLILKGDTHIVEVGGERIKGTHTVDAKKKPKTIDATETEGANKGKTMLGIWETDGDLFKVSFAVPGKERPKDFDSGDIIHVWKRQKK